MFVGLYRNIFSINAMTNFEKARMQVTYYGDTYPPDESYLRTVLSTLAGNDPETKASLAFNVIIAKMETSHSRKYWNYIVKNLVVLDRTIDEKLFLKDIANLQIKNMETYQPKEERYVQRKIGDLIRLYYKYIKGKAAVYQNLKGAIHIPKQKRREYFSSKTPHYVLEENKALSKLCQLGMELFQTGSNGHLKYHLNQYVFLLVLNTLLNVISLQYTAFIGIIEKFFETNIEVAKECFEAFKGFLKGTQELISVTAEYQFIPGFQISLYEIRNPKADGKLLKAMQEYIRMLQKKGRHNSINLSVDFFNIRPHDFHVKHGSEIDISLCLERMRSSNLRSPTLKVQGSNNSIPSQEIEDDDEEEEGLRPSRPSIMFTKSFNPGFHGQVLIGGDEEDDVKNIIEDDFLDIDAINIDDYVDEAVQTEPMEIKEDVEFQNAGVKFSKTLGLEEKDPVFEAHHNFFSKNFLNDVQTQYLDVYKRKVPGLYQLKTIGPVSNHIIEYGRTNDETFASKDFDLSIFENFMNTYSRESIS